MACIRRPAAFLCRSAEGGLMPPHRLLILACSARKQPFPGPAIEVYDGPLYRILRKAQRTCNIRATVYLLSAQYGLIPAAQPIVPYDRRMTRERARVLRDQVSGVLSHLAARHTFAEIYLELGQAYRPALPPDVTLTATFGCLVQGGQGGIGQRGAALKTWLRRYEGQ
jgi:hypothetical protein